MKALTLRFRLTIWYSLILAVSLGIFGGAAYFAMSHSIRSAVDAGLQRRVAGIRGIIARTEPEGLAALKDELSEYDARSSKLIAIRVNRADFAMRHARRTLAFSILTTTCVTTRYRRGLADIFLDCRNGMLIYRLHTRC